MSDKNFKKNYGFENINSILDKVVKNLGIDRGLREITLVNLWGEIIGPKFKKDSKAVSVIRKNGFDVLLVAVSSSIVSQELFLFKKDILRRLSTIALSLDFNIKDLIFSTKLWGEVQEKGFINSPNTEVTHYFKKNPTDTELLEITVPESIIDSIKKSIETQNFSSSELKDRMMQMIIKDIKTQIWRKNNGFPFCTECGIPINHYKEGKKALCPSCKFLLEK